LPLRNISTEHLVEYKFWESKGLLIAGNDFFVNNLAEDICSAISKLLATTEDENIDITFSVCSSVFGTSSHRGGIVRVFGNGSTLLRLPANS